MYTFTLILLMSLAPSLKAFAHGEHTPGPHGGHIQMPGIFHTELLSDGPNSYKVYLLDAGFKNPTTLNSEVNAEFTDGAKAYPLQCSAEGNFFQCKSVHEIKSGTLTLKAKRNGTAGTKDAKYSLPLKPFTEQK